MRGSPGGCTALQLHSIVSCDQSSRQAFGGGDDDGTARKGGGEFSEGHGGDGHAAHGAP